MKRLSENKVRYLAYQAMLEHGLNSSERDRLFEAGMIDKVMSWLGAGKDTATQLGGAAKKLFNNSRFARRMAVAEKSISKEIEELKALAKDSGQPEEAVYGILKAILEKAGVSEENIENPPNPEAAEGGEGGEDSGTEAGQPVDPSKPETAVPTIVRAAAQASGQDPEKAQASAEEKKVDAPKATQVLAKAIAKSAKADVGLTQKAIEWLIQNKHLVAESGGRLTANDLLRAAKSALDRSSSRDGILLERWSKMAGLLREEDAKKGEEAKKRFGDLLDDLKKALNIEDKDAEPLANILIALDDLEAVAVEK